MLAKASWGSVMRIRPPSLDAPSKPPDESSRRRITIPRVECGKPSSATSGRQLSPRSLLRNISASAPIAPIDQVGGGPAAAAVYIAASRPCLTAIGIVYERLKPLTSRHDAPALRLTNSPRPVLA